MVYVHYKMKQRLKYLQKEVDLKYQARPCNDFVYDKEDPMIGWFEDKQG